MYELDRQRGLGLQRDSALHGWLAASPSQPGFGDRLSCGMRSLRAISALFRKCHGDRRRLWFGAYCKNKSMIRLCCSLTVAPCDVTHTEARLDCRCEHARMRKTCSRARYAPLLRDALQADPQRFISQYRPANLSSPISSSIWTTRA